MPALADYLDKITALHRDKPRFVASVTALLQPLLDLQGVLAQIPADYDLDAAIGEQLDAVGIWVGRSRQVETPLENVYFSFDEEGLGWSQAVWKGPFDPLSGLVFLPDDSYRVLLKAKIAANTWDGTSAKAAEAFTILLADKPGTMLVIDDNHDMTMFIGLSGVLPDVVTQAIITKGYLPLKPVGVGVTYFVTSIDGEPLFGFGTDNDAIAGWGEGAWGIPI